MSRTDLAGFSRSLKNCVEHENFMKGIVVYKENKGL